MVISGKERIYISFDNQRIIGAALKAHIALGNGFRKSLSKSIRNEFEDTVMKLVRELSIPVYHESGQTGERRVDLFAAEKIMVEIKAIIQQENVHLAQAKKIILKLILAQQVFNLKDWKIKNS
jgi:GxxExxY protein